jgi:hypothetical protein
MTPSRRGKSVAPELRSRLPSCLRVCEPIPWLSQGLSVLAERAGEIA